MADLFSKPLRLMCRRCDREDADGVFEIPDGWTEIIEDKTHGDDDGKWWTHSGVCPDCSA